MPSFSIRLRRVFGWSLRIRAAPLGPWMTPAVDSSTATMCRRSISSKGAMSSGAAARTPAVRGRSLCAAGSRNRFTGATRGGRQGEQIWIDFQDRSLAQHNRTFNHVLELAHVSRPLVGTEMLHRLRRHGTDQLPETPGEARKEKHDQLRDVGTTFAQRRDRDRKHVQTVEEGGTEAPPPHPLPENAIHRCDHPQVSPKR